MHKKIKQFVITALVFSLALPAAALAVDNPPTIPLLVYGDVSLYGVTAPAGTIISVSKDSTTVATTTVNSAGKYFFEIPASYTDSMLTYKIGSLVAAQKVCLDPLENASDRINLVIAAPTPTPPPSGGGGSPSTSTPTPSVSVSPTPKPLTSEQQKVDANKDNKIDILDFNALMVNWGKTGSAITADFNSDGKVDIFDFNMLMINWSV